MQSILIKPTALLSMKQASAAPKLITLSLAYRSRGREPRLPPDLTEARLREKPVEVFTGFMLMVAQLKSQKQTQADRDVKLNAAHDQLTAGIEKLINSDNWQAYLHLQTKFHQYSFNNIMLILFACPHATQVAGFKAWQKLDRQVRKGEKGIPILAPMHFSQEDDPDKSYTRFRTAYVFDVSQTEGADLPEPCSSLSGDDQGLFERLQQFAIEHLGIPVMLEEIEQNGYCQFMNGKPTKIAIKQSLTLLHRCKTMAHETGHALMHSESEYRQHTTKSTRELEAESFAFCLLNYFNLDTSTYSFGYIAEWMGESAIEELKKSGNLIQQSVKAVLTVLDPADEAN